MLNAYMGYSRSAGSAEGACLIFAQTGKEAKKVGYPTMCDWFAMPWTDMAVKRLNKPHLFAEADAAKLAANVPHAVEAPKTCPSCHMWGEEVGDDGQCGYCRESDN